MKNSKNTLSDLNNDSFQLPKSWKMGDISPSHFKNDAVNLINYFLNNNNNGFDVKSLREDKQFESLYINIHKELEEGSGVIFLPNLINCEKLNKETIYAVFTLFCSFIGELVPLNKQGEILREVKDIGLKDSVSKPVRGHLTNQALAFHSDRADLTTLFCLQEAVQGGEFKIGSSAQLFRELQKRPDLLKILSTDIPHDLRDEGANDMNLCSHPVISNGAVFWVRYIRKFIDSTVRFGFVVDEKLKEALDYVDTIVNDPAFSQEIVLRPGDFIVFNNHLTLHSRNEFIDNEFQQRCLLRIWLASRFSRPLPKSLLPVFHDVAAGSGVRGGVR